MLVGIKPWNHMGWFIFFLPVGDGYQCSHAPNTNFVPTLLVTTTNGELVCLRSLFYFSSTWDPTINVFPITFLNLALVELPMFCQIMGGVQPGNNLQKMRVFMAVDFASSSPDWLRLTTTIEKLHQVFLTHYSKTTRTQNMNTLSIANAKACQFRTYNDSTRAESNCCLPLQESLWNMQQQVSLVSFLQFFSPLFFVRV